MNSQRSYFKRSYRQNGVFPKRFGLNCQSTEKQVETQASSVPTQQVQNQQIQSLVSQEGTTQVETVSLQVLDSTQGPNTSIPTITQTGGPSDIITTGVSCKTPITSLPGITCPNAIYVDPLQPIEEEEDILPNEYFFSSKKKTIIKGRSKKRKIEQKDQPSPEQIVMWNASKLSEEEYAKAVADSMRAFATANQWSVTNLKQIIKQQQDKITQLESKLGEQQSRIEEEHKQRIDTLLQQHHDHLENLRKN